MSQDHGSDPARTANLLGTQAVAIAGLVAEAIGGPAAVVPSHPTALIALDLYAEGEPIESLRTALSLSHSATVRLVDRLVADGLVAREQSPEDGRVALLRLTPAGRAEVLRVRAARTEALLEVVGRLEPAEQDALASLCGRVLAGLTTDGASPRRTCRLCDAEVCGHPERCPVTLAAHPPAGQ